MVCPRCIKVVHEEMQRLGFDIRSVQLGEVIVSGEVTPAQMKRLESVLLKNGFELIANPKVKLIESIKHAVLEIVQNDEEQFPLKLKHSEYIAKKVGKEYHSLSVLFSSVENITIEQFIILQKIERAKEFLKYGELSLKEISYKLGYSSVQHLSTQFKSVTGMTPTRFKNMTVNIRKSIDSI